MKITLYIQLFLMTILLSCKEEQQPNILFFITDDESWIERSVYGWSNIPTPHFDRVAEEGILFTNAFASAPSCAPSRASVLTGRDFWELEQGAFIQAFLPKKFPVFTQILEDNGYLVGHTGKVWGPGVYADEGYSKLGGAEYNKVQIADPPPGISSNNYAGNFELFLKNRNTDQPFFFWAGITEPHLPHGSENYLLLEEEFGVSLDKIQLFPNVENTKKNKIERANFIYEICYADAQLGSMLSSLEANGELENTLIIVTSDNGTAVESTKDIAGKASPYELGVHEPLAIMWPKKVRSGRITNEFVKFSDFAPTFLEAAGLKPPESMTGKSLLPLLFSDQTDGIDADRNFVVTGLEWHGEFDPVSLSSRTIRNDQFAYILRYNNVDETGKFLTNEEATKPVKVEFYDLQEDPWQLNDLSRSSRYFYEMQALDSLFRQNGVQTNDPRVTGEMDIFRKARQYVQERKRIGYQKTLELPFFE